MELIDFFKYKALLAELETLKGKKKPVQDFIKKLYSMSNSFHLPDNANDETKESFRYIYILASKAITYDGSVNGVKYSIINSLELLRDKLINTLSVTSENISETYEFCNSKVYFRPKNIETLLQQDKLIDNFEVSRTHLNYYYVEEFKSFVTHYEELAKIFLLKNNPNSKLAKSIYVDQTRIDQAFEQLETLVNKFESVLKDKHEYISSSS